MREWGICIHRRIYMDVFCLCRGCPLKLQCILWIKILLFIPCPKPWPNRSRKVNDRREMGIFLPCEAARRRGICQIILHRVIVTQTDIYPDSLFLNRLAYISSMKSGSGSFQGSCLLGAYEPNFFGFRPSSFAIRICSSVSLYRFFASVHASSFEEGVLFFVMLSPYRDIWIQSVPDTSSFIRNKLSDNI